MTSVKMKFRPSTVEGGQGTIYYQIIHNRVIRQQKTGYRIFSSEWDRLSSKVIVPCVDEERKHYLLDIIYKTRRDILQLNKIVTSFEEQNIAYTADDVTITFTKGKPALSVFVFMQNIIDNLFSLGKIRTAETYQTTFNSFKRYRDNIDLAIEDFDSDEMIAYEAYLHRIGIVPNTSSFYMRNLRAVYNRAVEKGFTSQQYPFKHVYTGIDKTVKRAVSLSVIKKIKELDFCNKPAFEFARNIFLFSFYTRGMSFVDIAFLRKNNLKNGILIYRRRKTGQQLFIKWEKCMSEVLNKYDTSHSEYLLPIINPQSEYDERKQYIYASHNINRNLKIIGKELGLPIPLTMYVARHAWASIAKSKNVPISVISEGMGHDSENTTRIYLASLDTSAIDKANSMILKSLI